MSLERIRERVEQCRACELWRQATRAVPGEGPEDSPVMVVGEAPGREEDAQGRPFVGRAGRLLRKILESYGLRKIYITNVVKHRPPGNRRPRRKEVDACSGFLLEEIEAIRPRIIIALGATASKFFTGKEGVGELSGRVLEYRGSRLIVTYHPAAVLRNPRLRKDLEASIAMASQLLATEQKGSS